MYTVLSMPFVWDFMSSLPSNEMFYASNLLHIKGKCTTNYFTDGLKILNFQNH